MNLFRSFLSPLAAATLSILGAISPPAAAQSPNPSATIIGASMPTTAQAITIHRFYEECLNQNHPELIPELFTPGVIIHSTNDTTVSTGFSAVQQTVARVRAMFPDQHFTVDDVVVNGDKAAARWSMTATNTAPIAGIPPTGRPVNQHAIVFYRFEGDKIAEFWLQMDQLGVLLQIGVQIPGMQRPGSAPSVPAQSAH
jgi:predicted ester cyclase